MCMPVHLGWASVAECEDKVVPGRGIAQGEDRANLQERATIPRRDVHTVKPCWIRILRAIIRTKPGSIDIQVDLFAEQHTLRVMIDVLLLLRPVVVRLFQRTK